MGDTDHQLGRDGGFPFGPQPDPARTSLVHLESTVGFRTPPLPERIETRADGIPTRLPPQDKYQLWVHGGSKSTRSDVYESLVRTQQTPARCTAFHQCNAAFTAWLEQRPSQTQHAGGSSGVPQPPESRIRASSCHDRLCPHCAAARAQEIRLCLHDHTQGKVLKFITLTLRSVPSDKLSERLDFLYKCFRYLRSSICWEPRVRGGAAFLEVTRGKARDRWHAHLHLIVDSEFIPQAELSATWSQITRGSFRVDVRPIEGNSANSYITKYATKALNSDLLADEKTLDEAVIALKGRRLCFCFGDWYGTPLSTKMETDPLDDIAASKGGWAKVLPLSRTLELAAMGDADCCDALVRTPFGAWVRSLPPDSS